MQPMAGLEVIYSWIDNIQKGYRMINGYIYILCFMLYLGNEQGSPA